MKTSSLEITEQEYLIKLSKKEYDLSFINQLLKGIQSQQFFARSKSDSCEDDIISSRQYDSELRFDQLSEK